MRRSHRTNKRVDLALGVTLGFLHHQFVGDIPVRADGLDQQDNAQSKTHRDQALEQKEFLTFAGHVRLIPAQPYIRIRRRNYVQVGRF